MSGLDMTKRAEQGKEVVLNMIKSAGIEKQKAKVMLCIDFSGSMSGVYARQIVQQTVERLVPIAMAFDDDGDMEVYVFSTGVDQAVSVSLKNLAGYVQREIVNKNSWGGTNYAPAIKQIMADFIGDSTNVVQQTTTITKESKGFFGLGKKTTSETIVNGTKAKIPGYVIFITDGDNGDKAATEQAMIEASKHGVFFQFVGLQTGSSTFPFLEKLDTLQGTHIDNSNYFAMKEDDLTKSSDVTLYGKLLKEFMTGDGKNQAWVKKAKANDIIE